MIITLKRIVIIGFGLFLGGQLVWADINRAPIKINVVEYAQDIKGYLVEPVQRGKMPALILIHEWWGLNTNIMSYAQRFAREGYVVLAVDLYGGQVTTSANVAKKLAAKVRDEKELAFFNLKEAMEYMKGKHNVDPDRMAAVGWCFGGGWSYQMAKNDLGIKASVIYYGAFNPKDDLSIMKAGILGHFAGKDSHIKVDTVKEFQANLKTLKGPHKVYIYHHNLHGFANEDNKKTYDPVASKRAWKRTLKFLRKNL